MFWFFGSGWIWSSFLKYRSDSGAGLSDLHGWGPGWKSVFPLLHSCFPFLGLFPKDQLMMRQSSSEVGEARKRKRRGPRLQWLQLENPGFEGVWTRSRCFSCSSRPPSDKNREHSSPKTGKHQPSQRFLRRGRSSVCVFYDLRPIKHGRTSHTFLNAVVVIFLNDSRT